MQWRIHVLKWKPPPSKKYIVAPSRISHIGSAASHKLLRMFYRVGTKWYVPVRKPRGKQLLNACKCQGDYTEEMETLTSWHDLRANSVCLDSTPFRFPGGYCDQTEAPLSKKMYVTVQYVPSWAS